MQEFYYKPGDIVAYTASDQRYVETLGVVTRAQGMTIDVLRKDGTVQKVHRNRLRPEFNNAEDKLFNLLNSIRKGEAHENDNT